MRWCKILFSYIIIGKGSVFDGALWSLVGMAGRFSSFGSTTKTLSGSGFLGPILPSGSNGNIIFTLMPSTPVKKHPNKTRWYLLLLTRQLYTYTNKDYIQLLTLITLLKLTRTHVSDQSCYLNEFWIVITFSWWLLRIGVPQY